MEYVTASEMSHKWGITKRRVNVLCSQGRIIGAIKKGSFWLLPKDSPKPVDARTKQEGTRLYDEIKW